MNAQIKINMDNAAFATDGGAELARILRRLAEDVETSDARDMTGQRLRDINGNTVGAFTVTE